MIYHLHSIEIETLVNKLGGHKVYQIELDDSRHTGGKYDYQLLVNDFTSTKKMMLVK